MLFALVNTALQTFVEFRRYEEKPPDPEGKPLRFFDVIENPVAHDAPAARWIDWNARTVTVDRPAASPEKTPVERAAATLVDDIVFRALVKTLAARFGVSVQTLVNEIKANV